MSFESLVTNLSRYCRRQLIQISLIPITSELFHSQQQFLINFRALPCLPFPLHPATRTDPSCFAQCSKWKSVRDIESLSKDLSENSNLIRELYYSFEHISTPALVFVKRISTCGRLEGKFVDHLPCRVN